MVCSNLGEPEAGDLTQQDNRQHSYLVGDPDSALDLMLFVCCQTTDNIKKLSMEQLLTAAHSGSATLAD